MNWSVALYSFFNSILDQKRQPLLMFSIYTNGKKIFACENAQSPNVIQCLHGIRSLATMWVIAGHTFVISIILPSRDFAEFIEVIINYCYDYFLVSGIYSKKKTPKKNSKSIFHLCSLCLLFVVHTHTNINGKF